MTIDFIVNHQSIPLCKPRKDQRSMEHIDVIMRTGRAKSIDPVMPRMTVDPSAFLLYCPCHANG
jgi:hypothetical protein